MKLLYKITETFNSTKNAFKRYPRVMSLIILAAISFIIVIKNGKSVFGFTEQGNSLMAVKMGYIFVLSSVLDLFISLFFEGLSQSAKNQENIRRNQLIKIIVTIVSILVLISIGQTVLLSDRSLFEYENGYIYFGVLLSLVTGCFFIAKVFYHSDFIAYTIKIITAAIISVGYTLVLMFGIFSIFFAINKLFGIIIEGKVYESIFVILMLPFNVGIFLSNFPRIGASFDNYEVSKPIKILFIYILIPIFIVYALIMYIYFGRIIVTGEIPKGIIANLILWFSLLEVALIYFLGIVKTEFVETFKKYFPIIMIPLLGMMFYAIFSRIAEYGVTENRFYVMTTGIFSLFANLYYIFYRKNSNIAIPMILSLILLLSSVGPLSAYRISAASQNARMKKILEKNDMLERNTIIPSSEVSDDDRLEIVQIVKYMVDNHRQWECKYLPNDYQNTDENFEKVFGFSPLYSTKDNEQISYDDEQINYYYDNSSSIDLMGYSKLMSFDLYSDSDSIKSIGNYRVSNAGSSVKIEYKENKKFKELFSFEMDDVLDKLKVLKESNQTIVLEDLSIKGSVDGIVYKAVFTELSGYAIKKDYSNYHVKFYLITGNV